MEKEKISVIIPTYNRGNIIEKSIRSVLNQTYKFIELLIVDDGSTDNTEEVVKKIDDDRIKYIKLDSNCGASHARNIGIKNASGKYISFQDSDDIYHIDKLEKQYNNLKKNNSDFDFCKIIIHDGDFISEIPSNHQIESIRKKLFVDELCNGNYISTQAILIKKEIAEKILFDERLPRFQDYDFVMRVIANVKVSYIDEVLIDLYRQENSISNNLDKLQSAITIILNKKYKLIKNQKELLTKNLIVFLVNNFVEKRNKEYETLNNKYINLETNYQNLFKENDKNKKNYNQIREQYNCIINSKRWKFVEKICKIIKK